MLFLKAFAYFNDSKLKKINLFNF